jgi:hypothetical protein
MAAPALRAGAVLFYPLIQRVDALPSARTAGGHDLHRVYVCRVKSWQQSYYTRRSPLSRANLILDAVKSLLSAIPEPGREIRSLCG